MSFDRSIQVEASHWAPQLNGMLSSVQCMHMLNHMTIYRALMTAVSVSVRKFSHLAAAIKIVSSTDSIMC